MFFVRYFFFPLPLYFLFSHSLPTPPSVLTSIGRQGLRNDLPFPVVQRMDDFRDLLNARKLASTCLSWDARCVRNGQNVRERDTSVGTRKKILWNYGGRSAQKLSFLSRVLIRCMLGIMNNWGTGDALATLWLTSAAALKITSPSFWNMFWIFCYLKTSITRLRSKSTGCVTWASMFVWAAAVVACFLDNILSKRFRCHLSFLTTFTLAAKHSRFNTNAVGYNLHHCLLLLRVTNPAGLRKGLICRVCALWKFRNIVFYLLPTSSLYHKMVLLVTNVPFLV